MLLLKAKIKRMGVIAVLTSEMLMTILDMRDFGGLAKLKPMFEQQ
jgi:hypothetical protein